LLTESRETENKFRFDASINKNGWKTSYGTSLQYVEFDNQFFNVYRKAIKDLSGNVIQPGITISSNTNLNFLKYGAFVQFSKKILNERMSFSAGTRIDGNNKENSESNPFKQFSPRLSASYAVSSKTNLNASIGKYYKLPSYTQLAFSKVAGGVLIDNPGEYIGSTHYVAGIEHLPSNSVRYTIEGFYKYYNHYPVSYLDGVSLANKGNEFGSIGNEPITQSGKGKAYGIEVLVQKKLTKRFFGILSYTFYHSIFSDLNGKFIPANWDNRHLLAVTWGYKFKRNWELGLKFRYQGAAPYTPFDMAASKINYITQGTGTFDNSKYNTLRLAPFNASDIRIDKKWNFSKYSFDLFLDVTNWYAAKTAGVPQYTFKRNADNTSFLSTDGQPVKIDGSNAIPLILPNSDAFFTPSFGFIVEF
jgi:outer membrane receptor for ferrienterochelin and colicin